MTPRRALVLGGSGAVGREVVRLFAKRDVPVAFTFHRSEEIAIELARETAARAVRVDLTDTAALRRTVSELTADGLVPDVLVHCAGVADTTPWAAIDDARWDASYRVNVQSALVAAQSLVPSMCAAQRGDVVFVGGLDRAQSLPVPVPWAASQGMLAALAMSIAKDVAARGVRVNMVALGPLTEGLSRSLDPRLREQYVQFSALRRLGTPVEAARAIAWLALENTYMNGKVLTANGGI